MGKWKNERHEDRADALAGAETSGGEKQVLSGGSPGRCERGTLSLLVNGESCSVCHRAGEDPVCWMWGAALVWSSRVWVSSFISGSSSSKVISVYPSLPPPPSPPFPDVQLITALSNLPLHSVPVFLLCLHPRPQLYTKGVFFLFIFHSLSFSIPPCEGETPRPEP